MASNYRIDDCGMLGSGAHGEVFSGIRINDNVPVALKFISIEYGNALVEIENHSKVNHIHGVIKMFDWFKTSTVGELIQKEEDKFFVLVFEKPENCEDLGFYLCKHKILPEDVAKKMFKTIFKTLKDCFEQDLLHGDIKADNILVILDENSNIKDVKLIDFGNGCLLHKREDDDFEETLESLGILLYNMLFGKVQAQITPLSFQAQIPTPCEFLSEDCRDLLQMLIFNKVQCSDIDNHAWIN